MNQRSLLTTSPPKITRRIPSQNNVLHYQQYLSESTFRHVSALALAAISKPQLRMHFLHRRRKNRTMYVLSLDDVVCNCSGDRIIPDHHWNVCFFW